MTQCIIARDKYLKRKTSQSKNSNPGEGPSMRTDQKKAKTRANNAIPGAQGNLINMLFVKFLFGVIFQMWNMCFGNKRLGNTAIGIICETVLVAIREKYILRCFSKWMH